MEERTPHSSSRPCFFFCRPRARSGPRLPHPPPRPRAARLAAAAAPSGSGPSSRPHPRAPPPPTSFSREKLIQRALALCGRHAKPRLCRRFERRAYPRIVLGVRADASCAPQRRKAVIRNIGVSFARADSQPPFLSLSTPFFSFPVPPVFARAPFAARSSSPPCGREPCGAPPPRRRCSCAPLLRLARRQSRRRRRRPPRPPFPRRASLPYGRRRQRPASCRCVYR